MTIKEKLEELIEKVFKELDSKIRGTYELSEPKMDELSLEIDRKISETKQFIRNLSDDIGKITDAPRRFAERTVAPALVKLFNERGIPITDYTHRLYSETRKIEYDIAAFNDNYVVVLLVKMTLPLNDVKEFLIDRLPIFKEVFPRYKDMKVIGAVAGVNFVDESDIYAVNHGLYVLAKSGNNITILNDDTFAAKVF